MCAEADIQHTATGPRSIVEPLVYLTIPRMGNRASLDMMLLVLADGGDSGMASAQRSDGNAFAAMLGHHHAGAAKRPRFR